MKRALAAIAAAIPVLAFGQALRVEADAGVDVMLRAAAANPAIVLTNSTGGALAKLCRGQIGIAGAARAVTSEERALCAQNAVELIEIPLATDSAVLVVNPANTWAKQLGRAELRRAWLEAPGKARSWKQLNAAWPDTPLKLYGPSHKLGLAGHARAALGEGTQTASLRADINSTEVLRVVVEGVARDRLALGLLDQATYAANIKRVRAVPSEGALRFPLYLYVNARALDDAGVRSYLDRLLASGAKFAAEAKLTALAPTAYEQARALAARGRAQ